MRKRISRTIALISALAMAGTLFTSCGNSAPTAQSSAAQPTPETPVASQPADSAPATTDYLSNAPLRVATMPHQMGVALYYADKQGLFKEAGINVELSMFSGGAAINEAIGAGEIDGAISGMAAVYSLANNLVTMVGEVDTVNSDGIVVRNDSDVLSAKGTVAGKPDMYGSADTLRGKSFLCQVGQAHQFYVSKYISQFGLTDDDINFVNMEEASAFQAYQAGEADVLSTKMPYIYTLLQSDYTLVADVKNATDIQVKDCVIFTPQTIKERREEVKIFLKVIYEIIEKMDADQAFRKQLVSDFYKENGKEFIEEQMDYEFGLNQVIGKKFLQSGTYLLGDGMQAVADFYGQFGSIDPANVDNVYKNYDPSLLSEVMGFEVKAFTK